MQQVVLPSLWPRKKNTRGPTGEEEVKDEERDVREEARREVEDERRVERERREDAEGLRWRSRFGEGSGGSGSGRYEMPGAMPGMMVA